MKQEILDQRKKYYGQIAILFEMVKAMKYREVMFMDRIENYKCIRGINIKAIDFLRLKIFEVFNFLEKDMNIYISCAKYKHIPIFTFNLSKRSSYTREWFNDHSKKEIIGYDLFFDFDFKEKKGLNRKTYLNELKAFYDLLMSNKICFRIMFSGINYQIIIPSKVWGFDKEKYEETNRIEEAYSLLHKIKQRLNLVFLDLKGAGVYNKVMKSPYSLVENKVCLPLLLFDGKDHKFTIDRINKITEYKYRGLMLKNDFGYNKNQQNFNNFIDKYMI